MNHLKDTDGNEYELVPSTASRTTEGGLVTEEKLYALKPVTPLQPIESRWPNEGDFYHYLTVDADGFIQIARSHFYESGIAQYTHNMFRYEEQAEAAAEAIKTLLLAIHETDFSKLNAFKSALLSKVDEAAEKGTA